MRSGVNSSGCIDPDRLPQFGVPGEHAVEADEVQAWAWYQRAQVSHEFLWRHHHVRVAVAPEGFRFGTTLPAALYCTRSLASAGRAL